MGHTTRHSDNMQAKATATGRRTKPKRSTTLADMCRTGYAPPVGRAELTAYDSQSKHAISAARILATPSLYEAISLFG